MTFVQPRSCTSSKTRTYSTRDQSLFSRHSNNICSSVSNRRMKSRMMHWKWSSLFNMILVLYLFLGCSYAIIIWSMWLLKLDAIPKWDQVTWCIKYLGMHSTFVVVHFVLEYCTNINQIMKSERISYRTYQQKRPIANKYFAAVLDQARFVFPTNGHA